MSLQDPGFGRANVVVAVPNNVDWSGKNLDILKQIMDEQAKAPNFPNMPAYFTASSATKSTPVTTPGTSTVQEYIAQGAMDAAATNPSTSGAAALPSSSVAPSQPETPLELSELRIADIQSVNTTMMHQDPVMSSTRTDDEMGASFDTPAAKKPKVALPSPVQEILGSTSSSVPSVDFNEILSPQAAQELAAVSNAMVAITEDIITKTHDQLRSFERQTSPSKVFELTGSRTPVFERKLEALIKSPSATAQELLNLVNRPPHRKETDELLEIINRPTNIVAANVEVTPPRQPAPFLAAADDAPPALPPNPPQGPALPQLAPEASVTPPLVIDSNPATPTAQPPALPPSTPGPATPASPDSPDSVIFDQEVRTPSDNTFVTEEEEVEEESVLEEQELSDDTEGSDDGEDGFEHNNDANYIIHQNDNAAQALVHRTWFRCRPHHQNVTVKSRSGRTYIKENCPDCLETFKLKLPDDVPLIRDPSYDVLFDTLVKQLRTWHGRTCQNPICSDIGEIQEIMGVKVYKDKHKIALLRWYAAVRALCLRDQDAALASPPTLMADHHRKLQIAFQEYYNGFKKFTKGIDRMFEMPPMKDLGTGVVAYNSALKFTHFRCKVCYLTAKELWVVYLQCRYSIILCTFTLPL